MSTCPICLHKDSDTLDAIQTAYLDEGASAEDLSIEFSIPFDLMMDHLSKCIKSGDGSIDQMQDRSEDLVTAYERLREAIKTAHDEYMMEPKGSNAQGYSLLINQFRGMVIELQQLDSPEKLAAELSNDVVGPLVARLITTLTEELQRTREELNQKTQSQYAKPISAAINDLLKRLGSRISMDQQEAVIKIQKRFNLEDDALPKKNKGGKKPGVSIH